MAAAHVGPAVEAVAGPGCRVSGFELEFREAGGALRWEAVERMSDRLRIRLDRAARNWAAIRGGTPVPLAA